MPEGPSIAILKEECAPFIGKKIIEVTGNSKSGIERLDNKTVLSFRSFGKNLFICFRDFSVRIHLMLFGSYRINEKKDALPRLSLKFKDSELNFYNCVVQLIETPIDALYDWELDVMSDKWNYKKALALARDHEQEFVCDLLLDQHVFAGVGNIIKNEILYRIRVHPLSTTASLPSAKLKELVMQAREYSFDFYNWKKKFELKQHWLAYRQKMCLRCNLPIVLKVMGKTKRRTFFCANCQKSYSC